MTTQQATLTATNPNGQSPAATPRIFTGRKAKYTDYLKGFTQLGYTFRMNEMNDSIECNGERINDGMAAKIESQMEDAGFNSVVGTRRAWTRLAYENKYHPIREYLDSLEWLGEDVFGLVLSCFAFADPDFARAALWHWSLGVIAKALDHKQNYMLVLDGKQGLGKSYFARWLCPLERYFVEGSLAPDHNDTKLRIIANWMWEVGELQYTTRKADVEALKNIISQKIVTVRPPYARHDIEKPITCSFLGTINETGAGFLNDPTGTRRFAVIRLLDINWNGYTRLNVDQYWAQVYAAYKADPDDIELPDEAKERQHEINAEYDTISSTHEMLLKFYDIDPIKYSKVWTPASDILLDLQFNGLTGSQRANQMEIASIMAKIGIDKSNADVTTGYGRRICYRGVVAKAGAPKRDEPPTGFKKNGS